MKTKLFIVFIFVTGIAFLVLQAERNYKVEKYIQNKSKEHQAMYNSIYHSFKKRADLTYKLILNNPTLQNLFIELQTADSTQANTIRKKLYKSFLREYTLLKDEGVHILHFHTKDNYSFLRFHNPNLYGDNLTDIRKTVTQVNQTKKPVHGFEVGRFHNGYRFVYPIFNLQTNEYLGSVEISFSLKFFVMEFINTLDVLSNFRIKKDIVDRKTDQDSIMKIYKIGKIDNYYSQKDILSLIDSDKRAKIKKLKTNIKTIQKGISSIEKGNIISLFDIDSQSLITFIPVFNTTNQEVCGFTTIRSNDKYIYNKALNTYFILFLISFITLIGLYYIYKKSNEHKIIKALLQEEVDKKTKELQEINLNLEERVNNEVEKNIKHEMKIFEQSKLAGLGDMIGNIVHQWRQPLSSMSAMISAILFKNDMKLLDASTINDDLEKVLLKIQYLSETIETFRNYLKEDKAKQEVILQERVKLSLSITEVALKDNHIKLIEDIQEEDIRIQIVLGELTQVLINIINNAKDVLLEKHIENSWIKISVTESDGFAIITIEDNGGGIPDDVMPKIFDQYFTTKDDSIGTGLGLHMSYQIITQSLDGTLEVANTQNGAIFTIKIPSKQ